MFGAGLQIVSHWPRKEKFGVCQRARLARAGSARLQDSSFSSQQHGAGVELQFCSVSSFLRSKELCGVEASTKPRKGGKRRGNEGGAGVARWRRKRDAVCVLSRRAASRPVGWRGTGKRALIFGETLICRFAGQFDSPSFSLLPPALHTLHAPTSTSSLYNNLGTGPRPAHTPLDQVADDRLRLTLAPDPNDLTGVRSRSAWSKGRAGAPVRPTRPGWPAYRTC